MTSVRALFSDFGTPTMTRTGGQVTSIEWTKDPAHVLAGDDAYYEITLRARIPNTPYTQLQWNVHQVCDVNGTDETLSWDQAPGAGGNPAPILTVVPARVNPTGWNKFTIPTGATVPADKLGTYFGDALIVWKDAAAFSSNVHTAVMIAATAGVTALSTALVAGDEVWVRY